MKNTGPRLRDPDTVRAAQNSGVVRIVNQVRRVAHGAYIATIATDPAYIRKSDITAIATRPAYNGNGREVIITLRSGDEFVFATYLRREDDLTPATRASIASRHLAACVFSLDTREDVLQSKPVEHAQTAQNTTEKGSTE